MQLRLGRPRHIGKERGQVIVLFALLVPVILTIGSIVISAGNWYVLKRHLQTQVDAAAFAGGPAFTGCAQDPVATNIKIAQQALRYAGDTLRDPTAFNLQLQEPGDAHVVLNSSLYWSQGDPPDALDWTIETPGKPCDTKFLDVKATDYRVPLLWRWIPLFPSVKTRARVEIDKILSTNGVLPIGVPDVDPVSVAVVFVDEYGDPNSVSSIVGKSYLDPQTTPPAGLEGMSVWSKDILSAVDLNGSESFGAVIVASRDPLMSIFFPTLSQICNQDPVQTRCYSGGTPTSGISHIHSYSGGGSGSASDPIIRQVELAGGCGQSGPYFNVDDGVSCNAILIQATIDFGTGANDPTLPAPGGVCAEVNGFTYSGGVWTGFFTPAVESGGVANEIDLSWSTDTNGGCDVAVSGPPFLRVAKPYVADEASGPVQYLTLENLSAPFGLANSIEGTSSASLRVTVGLFPPLRDALLSDPPIRLPFGGGPSQTHALDCGPNGWSGNMATGCDPYQLNTRNGSCASPYPVPPDCIANGSFNTNGIANAFANPCTPNNWNLNGFNVPPDSDPRWVVLFILGDVAFTQPVKTYPIRRFGGFYVTAGAGMNCPGDVPSSVASKTLWGHFVSYVTPGFGETVPVPGDQRCSFDGAGACVANLVE